MPPLDQKTEDISLFRGLVLNSETPEELDQKAAAIQASAAALRKKQADALESAKEKEKEFDMHLLSQYQNDLKINEDLLNLSAKMDLADIKKLQVEKSAIISRIHQIESKYGFAPDPADQEDLPKKAEKAASALPTIAKVTALVVACWAIVFGSGEWIMEAYPNAAVYNVVSFQKVLFAFSVFMAGIASVIASLVIFFPGLAKYFNPFNRDQLDFFNDFKILSEWQRVLISVVLFCALFFAFVMTASGKLD